ncbi:MAG: hypothetical protein PWQ41_342 [Bacillota bacterium]|nr:hypothetical protein [Bacillota bacterium]MDK2924568.1 hypothetical protein [Bacillota bacterium]
MNVRDWFLLIGSVALSSAAQLMIKIGLKGAGGLEFSPAGLRTLLTRIVESGWLIAGFAAFVASALLWLLVLSRTELSRAYPLVSLGYVFVLLLAHFVLGETIPARRLAGVAAIVAGVILIGGS